MKKLISSLLLISCLSLTSVVSAALVSGFSTGVTSIGGSTVNTVIDSTSGIEWLNVTASLDKSYNYVSSNLGTGGLYDGWAYATGEQLSTMMFNYTGEGETNPLNKKITYSNSIDLEPLVTALGITKTYGRVFGLLADEKRSGKHYYGVIDAEITYVGGDDFKAHYGYKSDTVDKSYIGSYLVRIADITPIPVPAAAFLFAPALIGFMGLRRKAAKNA